MSRELAHKTWQNWHKSSICSARYTNPVCISSLDRITENCILISISLTVKRCCQIFHNNYEAIVYMLLLNTEIVLKHFVDVHVQFNDMFCWIYVVYVVPSCTISTMFDLTWSHAGSFATPDFHTESFVTWASFISATSGRTTDPGTYSFRGR